MTSQWISNWRLLTYPLRMRPSFVLPGETKCGTTTCYRCLAQHPLIASSDEKEPNNFIRYGGTACFCRMHYPLSWVRWRTGGRTMTGEASAEYLSKPHVPASIAAFEPDMKLIFMFRNPVLRALSDFKMMAKAGREPEAFEPLVERVLGWLTDDRLDRLVEVAARADAPPLRYVTKGLYARSLGPWLETFPRRQMLFVKSEDFFEAPQRVLDTIFDFLGVGPFALPHVPHLRRAEDRSLPDRAALRALADFYAPHNRELYALLERDLGWEAACEALPGAPAR